MRHLHEWHGAGGRASERSRLGVTKLAGAVVSARHSAISTARRMMGGGKGGEPSGVEMLGGGKGKEPREVDRTARGGVKEQGGGKGFEP